MRLAITMDVVARQGLGLALVGRVRTWSLRTIPVIVWFTVKDQ